MDCFRCGSSVPAGQRACPACGQRFGMAAQPGGKDRAVSKLARRFRLRRVLGEGPIGSVYAARDEERRIDVAVKMVRPELAGAEGDRNAFVVAMGRVDAIEHANVAPVLECGVDGERGWIVSPLLVGLPLRKLASMRRARGERFVLEEVVPILAQIVDALVAGAPLGPHGDLKPENVILLPDRLVVTDFGLAHAFSADVFARAQRVSPLARAYRAPELDAGARPTPSTDVYALAVIATELLAGHPIADSVERATNEVLPPEAGAVLAKAVSADPGERPETVEALLAELASVETGGPLVDSTTVRRRLSETTQKITMDQIQIVSAADDGLDVESVDAEPTHPEALFPVEKSPREVTQQVSMDMIVREPPAQAKSVAAKAVPAPAPRATSRPPAAPIAPVATPVVPVISAPVVTASPGAPEPPEPPRGPVAGIVRGAPASVPPKVAAERTDRWITKPAVVLFDDSADTALRPKDPTQPTRLDAEPEPEPALAAPKKGGAGWLLFLGAAIAGLLLGAGFYWSQRSPTPPQVIQTK